MSTGTIDVVRERLEALVWQKEANDMFPDQWNNPELVEALTKVKILGEFAEGLLKDLDRMEEWEFAVECHNPEDGTWELQTKWAEDEGSVRTYADYLNGLAKQSPSETPWEFSVVKRRKPEAYQYV